MILELLITAFAISLLIAGRFPGIDRILALTITLMLMSLCSTFKGGFDYENYLDMIEWVQGARTDDLMIQLATAMDPLFLVIVMLAAWIGDDPLWVFLILSTIALLPKFWLTARFPAYRSLMISSYGLFLAPTLEFAAIRAAAALGILALTFCFAGIIKKTLAYILAIASHVSTVVPVFVLIFSRIIRRFPTAVIAGGVVLSAVFLSGFVRALGRAEIYSEDAGSLFALGPPLVTMLLMLLVFSGRLMPVAERFPAGLKELLTYIILAGRLMRERLWSTALLGDSYQAALVCTCVALGGSLLWVSIAHRFLEFGHFFFFVAACLALQAGYPRARVVFGLLGVAALLVLKNLTLGTWAVLM